MPPQDANPTPSFGGFGLRGVAPGNYRVIARSEEYIEQLFNNQAVWDDADLVSVGGEDAVTSIDFALNAGATITGRLTHAVTGKPIANVGIGAEPDGGGPGSWGGTDSDGTYTLRGLAPGRYGIRADASHLGYIPVYYKDALRWDDAKSVAVSGTDTVTGIDFALREGETISGKVTDARTGLPVRDIEVWADNRDGGPGAGGRTDAEGRFTIGGLATGRYTVGLSGQEQGYVRQFYKDKVFHSDADLVTVTAGGVTGIDFALRPGASISGNVTDAATGRGIQGMEVHAGLGSEGVAWESTDFNGAFTLRGLPEGEIEVVVRGQGYLEQRRSVSVKAGEHVEGFDF